MAKKATQKELLAMVTARLETLRAEYQDPRSISHPQIRECMQQKLGEITALDEVRLVLLGCRKSFIVP